MSDKGGDGVNWLDWVITGVFGYLILLVIVKALSNNCLTWSEALRR
jgi:hypothetical protein